MSGSERWIVVLVGLLAGAGLLVFLIVGLGLFDGAPIDDGVTSVIDDTGSKRTKSADPPPVRPSREDRRETRRDDPRREDPVPGGAFVAGRTVTDKRVPLAGVEIRVVHMDPTRRLTMAESESVAEAQTTGADGKYRIAVPPGSGYGIVATKSGYADARMAGVSVKEGETKTVRDLIFVVGGTIRGYVYGDSGGGIEGAKVLAVMQKKLGLGILQTQGPHAMTDSAGFYEIRNIPPGVRHVFAGAQGYATQLALDVTVDDAEASEQVDFTLYAGKKITGHVFELDTDAPIEDAQITAMPVVHIDPARGEGTSDGSGYFELGGLSKYSYRVTARKKGYVPSGIQIAAGGMEMEFFLVRNGGISGQVVDAATGAPIEGFAIRYGEASGGTIQGLGRRMEVSDPSGNFEILDLNPKSWIIEAWSDGYSFAKTEPIQLAKGEWVDGIQIRLGRGGTVEGLVVQARDGAPVRGARVEVRPDESRPFFILSEVNPAYVRSATTGSDGRFVVTGIGPGPQRVDVTHEQYRSLEGESFEVGDAGAVDLGRLAIEAGGIIEGTVLLADGTPVPHAQILLNQTDGTYRNRAKTDESGFYRFTRLPSGGFTLEVERIKGALRKTVEPSSFGQQRASVADGDVTTVNF